MTDKKKQIEKFHDKARELECDDDKKHFAERLGKLVKGKQADKKETPVAASKGPRRGR